MSGVIWKLYIFNSLPIDIAFMKHPTTSFGQDTDSLPAIALLHKGGSVNLHYVAQLYPSKKGIEAVIVGLNGQFKLCRIWQSDNPSAIEDMMFFLERDIEDEKEGVIYIEALEKELRG